MFIVFLENGRFIQVENDDSGVVKVYNSCGLETPVLLYEHKDIISVCRWIQTQQIKKSEKELLRKLINLELLLRQTCVNAANKLLKKGKTPEEIKSTLSGLVAGRNEVVFDFFEHLDDYVENFRKSVRIAVEEFSKI